VSPSIVLDMFIRNNWENTKLVPVKKYQKNIFVDMEKGTLKITGKDNLADLGESLYIKTQAGPNSYNLWRLKEREDEEVLFEKISPLGNNHEYLEIYLDPNTKALKETSLAKENLEVSELETISPMEEQESENTDNAEISEEEQTDNVRKLTEAIMKQVPSFSENQAENKIEEMKENPKLYGGFLQNVFKQMGITLDKEKAIKKFKKMC
jgi:rRNA maturation endonuclease Nob1